MFSVVSVQVYHGETPLSCTLQYSADTYGNNKTGALLQLCKALMAYSDSAKAYFLDENHPTYAGSLRSPKGDRRMPVSLFLS
ncbi:MAG: hypothetical protein II272_05535 [Oscillospiraceae bacterium]|nr:hypothetical protein [Oscillospiraceae bacterium]